MVESEGTYLLWLDCRGMGLDDADLHRFFIDQVKVAMSPWTLFGSEGAGFMRLNMAVPRVVIMNVLRAIRSALSS